MQELWFALIQSVRHETVVCSDPKWSLQNYAHGSTAVLSFHIFNCCGDSVTRTKLQQNKILVKFKLQDWDASTIVWVTTKAASEMYTTLLTEIDTTAFVSFFITAQDSLAIIRTSAGILIIWHLQTNFSEIFNKIHTFSLKKVSLNMSSAKVQWWPSSGPVLTCFNYDHCE